MHRVEVVLLTKPDCAFCDDARAMLERLSSEFPLELSLLPLESSEGEGLAIRNGLLFPPGILLDGKPFSHGRPSEGKLRRQLRLLCDASGGVDQPPIRPTSGIPQVDGRR